MATARDELYREALQLSEAERAELAGMLLDSIEPSPDPDVEKAWLIEIERRMEQLDTGQVQSVPWDQVRARLRGRLDG